MKKLIALMMCAMLLLSGCAAVTAEGPGTGIQLGDLVVTTGAGETLDLTGLSISYELAESDTSMGCRAAISAGGQENADIIWAIVGQYLYLSMPGTEGIHSYALDLVKVGQALSDAADGISEEIRGIIPAIFPGTGESAAQVPTSNTIPEMTDEELEAAMAELEEAMAGLEDGSYASSDSGTNDAVQQAMDEKLDEIINRCVTAEMTQIGGEDFQVITFDIGADDMMELLNTVPMDETTGVTVGQVLTAAKVTIALQGTVTGNQDFSKYEIVVTPTVTVEETPVSFTVSIEDLAGDGVIGLNLSAVQAGQSVGSLALTFAATTVTDGSWLPAELSADTIILTEMPLEQVEQVLLDGFNDYLTLFSYMVDNVAQANQAG